ncbi:transcription factor SOX7/8/10/18 (SOX group E/F) [Sarotherodon galilaeus]
MLKLIMVLLWMILLVVLLCAEAKNVTEVRGELGTNVTLTCSNQTADTHCFSSAATYCSPGFETKFSILGNKLVIKNFTAEDCRLYFCGIRRDGSIQFVETFCLVSDVTIIDPQSDCRLNQLIIICVSVAVIVFVILGAVCAALCLKRKKRRIQKNNVSLHIYENAHTIRAAQNKAIHSQQAKPH